MLYPFPHSLCTCFAVQTLVCAKDYSEYFFSPKLYCDSEFPDSIVSGASEDQAGRGVGSGHCLSGFASIASDAVFNLHRWGS